MSDTNAAPAAGADTVVSVPVRAPAEGDNFSISTTEAAKQLADWRLEQVNPKKKDETPAEAAPESAEPPIESGESQDDAPPEEAPVETTAEAEPEETPPIEPPRSWTKEEKEEFATYPREAQEKIARREQDRETALRRSQNEAAEKLKGLTAKEQQVEQARQDYERALPALLQTLQTAQSGEFADIKTQEDVNKLAAEDWPRFARWQAHTMQVASLQNEIKTSQDRQAQEYKSKWSDFASKQDQLLLDKAPELSDKTKQQKIADGAVSVLRDIGFDDKELASAWNGESSVSLRDHRIQLLILDAMKYREAKASAAKPLAKPVPAVQRPGVSKAPARANDAEIQALEKTFDKNPTAKNAAALRAARQRAA